MFTSAALTSPDSLRDTIDTVRGQGSIALIRGFDRSSRALRDELRAIVAGLGVELLDITAARRLGPPPSARKVSLVIASRGSLLAPAQRYAAHWNATVLHPDVLTTGGELTCTRVPTVAVRFGEDRTVRSVVSRFSLSGTLWPVEGTGGEALHALAVVPDTNGMVVTFTDAGAREQMRTLHHALTVELAEPAIGHLDSEQRSFHEGRYVITPAEQPLSIIAVRPTAPA
ncbi:MAG: hypothetical protein ACRDRN_05070 [Sciscionella sp.]